MIERVPERADLAELLQQPEAIVEVHRSINDNLMSAESYPTQRSEATIVIVRDGGVQLYVHYHLYEDDVGLLYQENDPITRENFAAIRDLALESVEAMGFILERIELRGLSENERKQVLQPLPAFGGRSKRFGGVPGDSTGTEAPDETADVVDESVFLLEDTVDENTTASVTMPLPGERSANSRARFELEPETWEVFLRMAASL